MKTPRIYRTTKKPELKILKVSQFNPLLSKTKGVKSLDISFMLFCRSSGNFDEYLNPNGSVDASKIMRDVITGRLKIKAV